MRTDSEKEVEVENEDETTIERQNKEGECLTRFRVVRQVDEVGIGDVEFVVLRHVRVRQPEQFARLGAHAAALRL
eukprot:3814487-Pleurochrysis_carterae.AAC.3